MPMDYNLETLPDACKELMEVITHYESDTFSAEVTEMTSEEAHEITNILVIGAIEKMLDGNTLDGVDILRALQEVRSDK